MALGICSLAAMTLVSGCVVGGYGGVAVEAPPPAVMVEVYPDYYFWDGYEYVGLVGGRYYYLGPRHVWIACEPFRVERFHRWERFHPDWRYHAIPNEHYRHGGRGHGRDHDRGHGHHHDDDD
ncbi:MAG: hypothetical protein KGJ60_11225 [Verrucomicrobiota bacterium]|nr:hypothetical protein [Verrucomicrobiota bacterium]